MIFREVEDRDPIVKARRGGVEVLQPPCVPVGEACLAAQAGSDAVREHLGKHTHGRGVCA